MKKYDRSYLASGAIMIAAIASLASSRGAGAIEGGEVIPLPSQFQGTLVSEIHLPQILDNPRVPTDITGPGGSLGYARGLRDQILGPEARNVVPDAHAVPRDDRYSFIGKWIPFGNFAVATTAPGMQPGRELIATRISASDTVFATEKVVAPVVQGVLMPTADARFRQCSDNEVSLSRGALLVKPSGCAVIVSCNSGGRKVLTSVDKGALAMVSTIGDRVTVSNFIGVGKDDVQVFIAPPTGKTMEMSVPQGTETAIDFGPHTAIAPTLVTVAPGRGIAEQILADGTIRSYLFDYTGTMKRYGMVRALPEKDFNRLLHVAAAVSVVRGGM